MLALTSREFLDQAPDRGIRRGEALDVYRGVFRQGRRDVAGATVDSAPVVRQIEDGPTLKFVQRLADGLEIESVIIPGVGSRGRRRNTLCVSSQVGCAMGCTFCETARMGLLRNLDVSEIIGQWFAARHDFGRSIDNVVFMGMGEPLDNLEPLIRSIRILADDNGPAVAAARITVSTVGRIEGIDHLAELAREPGFGKLRLAVSVNAPNDALRGELMPINRAHPLRELSSAMRRWPGGRILIEYVLIPEVNDRLEHAEALCGLLHGLRCTVNVIPYNPRRESPWPAPEESAVDGFVRAIAERGQAVRRRTTRGRQAMAACGQLGNPWVRRRRFVGAPGTDRPKVEIPSDR